MPRRILIVMKLVRLIPILGVSALLSACATQQHVDMSEPRRLVATESDVRLDAEIRGDTLGPASQISISYDVTNNRQTSIAIADLIPDASYDADTQTVVIALGAEVPGTQMLPRLQVVPPGQKKSFVGVANVNLVAFSAGFNPMVRYPHAVRIRLDFLNDTKPFEKLVGIPERAVADAALAAELFPKWVEQNETLVTSALPMRWQGEPRDDSSLPFGATTGGRKKPPGT